MLPNQPQRLLVLTTSDAVGGMQRVVAGLVRQFCERGVDVRSVFPRSPASGALLAWMDREGVPAEVSDALPDAAAPHTLAGMRSLRRFVRAARPDVVSVHYGDNFISLKDVAAVRLAGRARVVISVYHPTPWGETARAKRWLTLAAASLADAVVVESDAVRNVLLQAGVRGRKLHVIPCGVRPPGELPSRMDARRALGLPADAFVVGSLARLTAHKGIDDLIEAVAALGADDNIVLVVAGDGEERRRLQRIAAERLVGRALFPGRIDDPGLLYAAADVFALPSRMEGFGLVYIEAAFHGVPSVGADAGGVREAVRDGETGFLVPPGDVPALAGAIRTLREDSDLRRRLGAAARARALAEFTETTMADRHAAIFWPGAGNAIGRRGTSPALPQAPQ